MSTKLHVCINQVIRPLKLAGRKRLTWHSFLHTLTSKTVSQIFDTCVCYFLLQDKVRKEKKIELPAEKSHNFLMRGIKRIRRHGIVRKLSDNSLSKFQPI